MEVKFVIAGYQENKKGFYIATNYANRHIFVDVIENGKQFDTYAEAEKFLTDNIIREGYYQIEKVFIKK